MRNLDILTVLYTDQLYMICKYLSRSCVAQLAQAQARLTGKNGAGPGICDLCRLALQLSDPS